MASTRMFGTNQPIYLIHERKLFLINFRVLRLKFLSSKILSVIRANIDKSTEDCDNFTLLYLQSEFILVKNLIDSKRPPKISNTENQASVSEQQTKQTNSAKPPKNFSERILSFFRRSSDRVEEKTLTSNRKNTDTDSYPQIQILEDFRMRSVFFSVLVSIAPR
jgi:hypothetical protein